MRTELSVVIAGVARGSSTVAASSQQMASSAAELAVTAERLDELVGRFKLAV